MRKLGIYYNNHTNFDSKYFINGIFVTDYDSKLISNMKTFRTNYHLPCPDDIILYILNEFMGRPVETEQDIEELKEKLKNDGFDSIYDVIENDFNTIRYHHGATCDGCNYGNGTGYCYCEEKFMNLSNEEFSRCPYLNRY